MAPAILVSIVDGLQPQGEIRLKGKETQHSFAGLLNIYISGIWLWYMQALSNNRVKQNRCLKG